MLVLAGSPSFPLAHNIVCRCCKLTIKFCRMSCNRNSKPFEIIIHSWAFGTTQQSTSRANCFFAQRKSRKSNFSKFNGVLWFLARSLTHFSLKLFYYWKFILFSVFRSFSPIFFRISFKFNEFLHFWLNTCHTSIRHRQFI